MKNYLRILATSTLVMFGLSVVSASAHQAAATQSTSTDTSATTKSKRKRKSADTAATAAPAATAPATTAAPAAPAPKSTTRAKSAPASNASDADIAAAKASGKVWVNTESGVYHKGGQFYGKTKKGQFMTEDDAKKAGYHAAKGEIGTKKS